MINFWVFGKVWQMKILFPYKRSFIKFGLVALLNLSSPVCQFKGQVIIYRDYGAAKKTYRAMEICNMYCTGVENQAMDDVWIRSWK